MQRRPRLHPPVGLPDADDQGQPRSAEGRSGRDRDRRLRRLRPVRRERARRDAVPVFYRAEVVQNPKWHERCSHARARRLIVRALQPRMTPIAERPITLLICALGGEGGGVLTEWLVDAARARRLRRAEHVDPRRRAAHRRDHLLRRGLPACRGAARRPRAGVQPDPVPGASTRMVVLRAARDRRARSATGMASPERTLVITLDRPHADDRREACSPATAASTPTALLERSRGVQPRAPRVRHGRGRARGRHGGQRRDARRDRRQRRCCPSRASAFERRRARGGRGVEASLRGLAQRPCAASRRARDAAQHVARATAAWRSAAADATRRRARRGAAPLTPAVAHGFPAGARAARARPRARASSTRTPRTPSCTCSGCARARPPSAAPTRPARTASRSTRETARWLALWMAFDDIVRVADLKSRASRSRARAARGDGGRRRRRCAIVRPLQAGHAGVRGAAAAARSPHGCCGLGPRAPARGRAPLAAAAASSARTRSSACSRCACWPRCAGCAGAAAATPTSRALIERWLAAVDARRARRLGPRARDRAVRPPDQGLRRDQRARQGEPAAHARPPRATAPMPRRGSAPPPMRAAREAALADDSGKALDATLAATARRRGRSTRNRSPGTAARRRPSPRTPDEPAPRHRFRRRVRRLRSGGNRVLSRTSCAGWMPRRCITSRAAGMPPWHRARCRRRHHRHAARRRVRRASSRPATYGDASRIESTIPEWRSSSFVMSACHSPRRAPCWSRDAKCASSRASIRTIRRASRRCRRRPTYGTLRRHMTGIRPA